MFCQKVQAEKKVSFCNSHRTTTSSIWTICQKAYLIECSARRFILQFSHNYNIINLSHLPESILAWMFCQKFLLRSSSNASFSWLCVNIFCSLLLHLCAVVTWLTLCSLQQHRLISFLAFPLIFWRYTLTKALWFFGILPEVWFCNSLDNHIITASSIWAICQKACLLECSARSFIYYPSIWYPNAKQKSPFLHLFFSIKVCYAATARRRRWRSKFPNPDRSNCWYDLIVVFFI